MSEPETERCPACGHALPGSLPVGLCPNCALEAGQPPTIANDIVNRPGDRIGRYKLLQQIGEGGCGAVFMAEQESPISRKVALKVIKLGMDTKSVIARFEAERQALALMDHPHIAKVFDAGATETGRPYFVMELVRGVRITDYCDQHKLTTRERLDLFMQVCHAVQHAHQKGIIHRDIKPSNILVTLHDGKPVPKVIDFGIAKATNGQRLTDKTLFTAFEQFLGTPAYMSPEQAEMSGLDIDTRSDIYTLGVLFYELLTGKTPFDAKELIAAGFDAMRRTIREMEPPSPSARLSTMLASDLTAVAMHRQTEPSKLTTLLRGDLDWIVMKCLEKAREHRYETASALAQDIQRHLSNEPVIARPPSSAYKLKKFVRRNRQTVAAISLILIVLLGGVTASLWQWREAVQARKREEQRAGAEEEAKTQAVAARARAEELLVHVESQRARDFLVADDSPSALIYLAKALRQNPTNRVAAQQLMFTLSYRSFPFPVTDDIRIEKGSFNDVDLSPDARLMVTAASDGTAQIRDAYTANTVWTLKHQGMVLRASFSPDGQRVVTISLGREGEIQDLRTTMADSNSTEVSYLQMWDVRTGKPLTEPSALGGPGGYVNFSANGQRLLTVSPPFRREAGTMIAQPKINTWTSRLWDSQTGKILAELVRHPQISLEPWSSASLRFSPIQFSADGLRGIARSGDSAQLFSNETGLLLTVPLRHEDGIQFAEFSPNGRWVATASSDSTARLWESDSGRPASEPLRHEGAVNLARFSPDGQWLLTVSSKQTRVWNARNGRPLALPWQHREPIQDVHFSADGQRVLLVFANNTARVCGVQNRDYLTEPIIHSEPIFRAGFSSDGKRVFVAGRKMTRIWDVRPRDILTEPLSHTATLQIAKLSSNGENVVTVSGGQVYLWDVQKSLALSKVKLNQPVADVFVSERFAVGRILTIDETKVQVLDIQTARELTESLRHEKRVIFACFSLDGRHILTACDGGTAHVWDGQTGKPLVGPLHHAGRISLVQSTSDSQNLWTISTESVGEQRWMLQNWDMQTGQAIGDRVQHEGKIRRHSLSRDGKSIITASSLDDTARVWDVKSGEPLTPPLRHGNFLLDWGLSPDGQWAFTVAEGMLKLWEARTGELLAELGQPGIEILSATFRTDGKQIITIQDDRSVRVWDLPATALPVPTWLPELAEAIASRRINARGVSESVPQMELTKLKTTLVQDTSGDPISQWANFLLSEDEKRTISPGSSATISSYIERRIGEDTHESLTEVLRLDPANARASAGMAQMLMTATIQENAEQGAGADWYLRRALELSSDDARVKQAEAKIESLKAVGARLRGIVPSPLKQGHLSLTNRQSAYSAVVTNALNDPTLEVRYSAALELSQRPSPLHMQQPGGSWSSADDPLYTNAAISRAVWRVLVEAYTTSPASHYPKMNETLIDLARYSRAKEILPQTIEFARQGVQTGATFSAGTWGLLAELIQANASQSSGKRSDFSDLTALAIREARATQPAVRIAALQCLEGMAPQLEQSNPAEAMRILPQVALALTVGLKDREPLAFISAAQALTGEGAVPSSLLKLVVAEPSWQREALESLQKRQRDPDNWVRLCALRTTALLAATAGDSNLVGITLDALLGEVTNSSATLRGSGLNRTGFGILSPATSTVEVYPAMKAFALAFVAQDASVRIIATDRLASFLTSKNEEIVRTGLSLLEMESRQAQTSSEVIDACTPWLLSWLVSTNSRLADHAGRAMASVLGSGTNLQVELKVSEWIAECATEADSSRRRLGMECLGRIFPSSSPVSRSATFVQTNWSLACRLVEDSDPQVRAAALDAVRLMSTVNREAPLAPLLLKALKDPDPVVQESAAKAVAHAIGLNWPNDSFQSAFPELIRRLPDVRVPQFRHDIINRLEDMVPLIDDPPLLDQAAKALGERMANATDRFEQSHWAHALGELQLARNRPKEAVAAFEEATKSNTQDSRLRQRLNKAMWAAGKRGEAELMSAHNFPTFDFRDRLRTLSIEGDAERVVQLAARQMEALTLSSDDPSLQRHYDQDLIVGYVVEILTRLGKGQILDEFLTKESVRRPNSADTLATLARRKDANKQRDQAIELMERAVLAFPGNGNHLEELVSMYRRGKRQETLDVFLKRAIAQHPEAPYPAKELVQWYCDRRRTNDARQVAVSFHAACAQDSSGRRSAWKQSVLTEILVMVGDYESAIEAARKAVEYSEGNKMAQEWRKSALADLYRRAGKTNELTALEAKTPGLQFKNLLEQFREQARSNQFTTATNTALKLLTSKHAPHEKRAVADALYTEFIQKGQQARLLAFVRELLRAAPNDFELLRVRALVANSQSDNPKAIEYWERANAVKPDQPDVVLMLSESYNRGRRFTNTVELLVATQRKRRLENHEEFILATAYQGLNDTNGLLLLAGILGERATNGVHGSRSMPLRNLAKIMAMLGRHEEAVQHMRQVIADPNSWSGDDHRFLVQTYKKLGKLDEAIQVCLDGLADPRNRIVLQPELDTLYRLKGVTNKAESLPVK